MANIAKAAKEDIKNMSKSTGIDWDKAPEWADRVLSTLKGDVIFSDGSYFLGANETKTKHSEVIDTLPDGYEILTFEYELCALIEMRPDNWKEGEKRMEPIGQNGNEGEHYAELEGFNQKTDFNKQEKYGGEKGDFIDDFYEENSAEKFRGAMEFTIQKYWKRMGKKDDVLLELYKIADYSMRFYEKEKLRRAIGLESDK